MTYRQTRLEKNTQNEVLSVLAWEVFLGKTLLEKRSPFEEKSFLLSARKRLKILFVHIAQSIAGHTLYCEDDRSTLYQLPPETRALINWLISNDLLASWSLGRPLLPVKSVKTVYLYPKPLVTPSGGSYSPTGANGIGSGSTFSLAAISALGEFIERNASSAYWWENSRLYKSKFNNNSVQVNPDLFNVFTDASIPTHKKIEKYQSTHSLYWMPAVNFTHNKKIHIPASLAYMYFRREHPNEPFLQEVSSNGAATYSNYTEACTRAILELIERHVFISLWYQKKPCSKLNLNSLRTEFIEFDELLKSLSVSQEINIYEITDFLEVPTFMALLTNKDTSKTALHVTAASDLDANNALQKIIKEIIRFAEEQYPIDKVDKIPVDVNSFSNVKGYPDSLPARRLLWSYQDMLQHLAWLEESQEIEYSDIRCIAADLATAPARYCWLQEQSVNNDVTFYIANMTNSVARYAGLQVVRAISPDTIPMFFNEEFLPLGHPAFTHDADGNKIELNPVPHPFI